METMKVQFVKRQCCYDGGRVVAEIETEDLAKLGQWLIDTCAYEMGDGCSVTIWESLDAARDCYGDDLPEDLVAAFEKAQGGVMESINGCPPEYLPLPAKNTDDYWRAIVNDLTGCDWGDCDVHVD